MIVVVRSGWDALTVALQDVTANLTQAVCKFQAAAQLQRGMWYLDHSSAMSFASLGSGSRTGHRLLDLKVSSRLCHALGTFVLGAQLSNGSELSR